MTEIELDRPRVESDRFIVLLACGHWTHTRIPEDGRWPCPVIEPMERNDGPQRAALTDDGLPAILSSWEIYDDRTDALLHHRGSGR